MAKSTLSSHPRFAAWIGLAAGVTALVAFLDLALHDTLALVVGFCSIALAAAALWVAATRRGTRRAAAAGLVVIALLVPVVYFVAVDAVAELVVLVTALLAFAAGSNAALSQRTQAASRQTRPARSGRTTRGVLLMNPKSGGGKAVKFNLERECRRRRIEPIQLRPDDDLRSLARSAVRRTDVIGMAGGDGSQALVAEVAMEHEIPFVCIPAGTRNHFALDLGLDRDDVVGALDAFENGPERRVDLAFVNDRIFVNNVSLGLYAEIVQSEEYRDAKLHTAAEMLPELIGPHATPSDFRFTGPDGAARATAQLILVSNNPYLLDRLGDLGTRPRLDTGLLGIVAVEVPDARRAAKLAALEMVGRVRVFEGWLEWSVPEFELKSAQPVPAGIDGESVVLAPPLRFTLAADALTVLLPPGTVVQAEQRPHVAESVRSLWHAGTTGR